MAGMPGMSKREEHARMMRNRPRRPPPALPPPTGRRTLQSGPSPDPAGMDMCALVSTRTTTRSSPRLAFDRLETFSDHGANALDWEL